MAVSLRISLLIGIVRPQCSFEAAKSRHRILAEAQEANNSDCILAVNSYNWRLYRATVPLN